MEHFYNNTALAIFVSVLIQSSYHLYQGLTLALVHALGHCFYCFLSIFRCERAAFCRGHRHMFLDVSALALLCASALAKETSKIRQERKSSGCRKRITWQLIMIATSAPCSISRGGVFQLAQELRNRRDRQRRPAIPSRPLIQMVRARETAAFSGHEIPNVPLVEVSEVPGRALGSAKAPADRLHRGIAPAQRMSSRPREGSDDRQLAEYEMIDLDRIIVAPLPFREVGRNPGLFQSTLHRSGQKRRHNRNSPSVASATAVCQHIFQPD